MTKTLRRLDQREAELDRKLRLLDCLPAKLRKEPCLLNKEEIREVGREQREKADECRKELEREYETAFANRMSVCIIGL